MGGQSSQATTQQSQTNPWDAAQPMLKGILGQLQGNMGNTGVTGAENNALTGITNNATNYASTYGPQANAYAGSLLSGGGALNQAGAVNQNYQNYYNQTNPLASNTNYDPMQTPGIGDRLQGLTDQITQNVNGSFAAAGRDGSGYNQKALGQGLASGLAPVLTAQYNQNVQNQQGAAGNLYGAGNTTAGIQSGMQQNYLANQGQGFNAAGQALDASNAGNNAALQAEAQRRGIPVQALGLLAQIGIPIGGLGGTSSGSSTGTQTMSGAQQFSTIMQGIGQLIPKGPMNFKF
ncbi:hypothetical protein [Bradyrhizobium lablabi]|uniref:hypothetical protein n=1 Tax=Bradyrhizobium lablabi TaxID=722472 RepID=UPI00090A541F|nr:hypothetical protein [Bradyrhizobium lablabi]SHM41050.1 hypothetical protein SAMN05444321_6251 [Bradyrhizobium lablabi]